MQKSEMPSIEDGKGSYLECKSDESKQALREKVEAKLQEARLEELRGQVVDFAADGACGRSSCCSWSSSAGAVGAAARHHARVPFWLDVGVLLVPTSIVFMFRVL